MQHRRSLFVLIGVIFALITGLVGNSPAQASDNLVVVPNSGNWNYTDTFRLAGRHEAMVIDHIYVDCWDETVCMDQHYYNVQIPQGVFVDGQLVGGYVTFGAGRVCSKWQLDIGSWGAIVEKQNCEPTPTEPPTAQPTTQPTVTVQQVVEPVINRWCYIVVPNEWPEGTPMFVYNANIGVSELFERDNVIGPDMAYGQVDTERMIFAPAIKRVIKLDPNLLGRFGVSVGERWELSAPTNRFFTNNHLNELGQLVCEPEPTPVIFDQGPAQNTTSSYYVVGSFEIPEWGFEKPLYQAVVVNGVINQDPGMLVLYGDDIAIHQSQYPSIGYMDVGMKILVDGEEFTIASRDVMSKTDAGEYAMTHRVVITCTSDWVDNIVFTLVRVTPVSSRHTLD